VFHAIDLQVQLSRSEAHNSFIGPNAFATFAFLSDLIEAKRGRFAASAANQSASRG